MDSYDLGLGEATIFRAGELAPAGDYARVDRPGPVVTLAQTDRLPASFDGTVALYSRVVRVVGTLRC